MTKSSTLLAIAMLLHSAEGFFVTRVVPLIRMTMPERATVMRVTGIESTPNPSSFKFGLDGAVQSNSTRGFTFTTSTANLAPGHIQRVLEIPGVESVYALSNWLCLNKVPSAKWDSIVSAAVDALGGAAESLDPLTLIMASGVGEGDSGWTKSGMDGISIRVQFSNGIPIQVEACPPGGTPQRRKLSARFSDAMAEFVGATGDEMAFFKGRQWVDRGVRYPSEDKMDVAPSEAADAALTAAVVEIEQAFHDSRLKDAVAGAVSAIQATSAAAHDQSVGSGEAGATLASIARVRAAASALQSSAQAEVIAAVDTLCEIAAPAAESTARGGDDKGGASRDAFDALIGFAGSGEGPIAARRAAVAFVGGAGDAAGTAGLQAVAAVFRGDKNPGVRRTAGDSLSDMGDAAAVPVALAGLRDKSKLVRWRAARVVGELSAKEDEADLLDEARESEVEFEVAFEMADAARKIRSRVATVAGGGGGGGGGEAGSGVSVAFGAAPGMAGPVWKQIQERSGKP